MIALDTSSRGTEGRAALRVMRAWSQGSGPRSKGGVARKSEVQGVAVRLTTSRMARDLVVNRPIYPLDRLSPARAHGTIPAIGEHARRGVGCPVTNRVRATA